MEDLQESTLSQVEGKGPAENGKQTPPLPDYSAGPAGFSVARFCPIWFWLPARKNAGENRTVLAINMALLRSCANAPPVIPLKSSRNHRIFTEVNEGNKGEKKSVLFFVSFVFC
jgi:hypothetical protein